MPAIMEQLKADHGNISHLLASLEEQMAVVHAEENADFELMHDIMVYMTHYPDHTHHPMEDLMFQRLIGHDSSAVDIVAPVVPVFSGSPLTSMRPVSLPAHWTARRTCKPWDIFTLARSQTFTS